MTSFDALEQSVESSAPIELYTISIGSTTYKYTSGSVAVTIGVDTWEPEPLMRSSIKKSRERNEIVKVTFPHSNTFASGFLGIAPGQRAYISILRLQRDSSPVSTILIYKGQVSSAKYVKDGDQIELQTRSVEAATGRAIPRFTFMGMCNHILFDNGCKQTSVGFTYTGAVATVVDNVYTVTGADGQVDGFWTGGWCSPVGANDYRLVLAHTGTDLTLLLPFASDITGQDLEVYAGCDHGITACGTKFDNVLNFGGFPFVPNKNPFATGL
mgnify:FL=1